MKKQYIKVLITFLVCVLTSCKESQDIKEINSSDILQEIETNLSTSSKDSVTAVLTYNAYLRQHYELLLEEHITKDFLLGKVKRNDNSLFEKVDTEHTERNIYLLAPVYEAYKLMYDAALANGVKLIITSGHRTYVEQVCEWELRWNNPQTDTPFANDIEKARYILQYRSMPGTSRHHWGTDIDLNSFRLSYFETTEGKKVYAWLQNNAHKYGFFQSYTELGPNRSVGYNEEKWHWSYRPIAQIMLTKYLELVSKDDIKGFKGDKAVSHLDIIDHWVCGISSEMYALN